MFELTYQNYPLYKNESVVIWKPEKGRSRLVNIIRSKYVSEIREWKYVIRVGKQEIENIPEGELKDVKKSLGNSQ